MQISEKIEVLFESLSNEELKQILQLTIDRKPEESGLLGLIEFKIKSLTTKKCILHDTLYNKNVVCKCDGHFCTQTGEQINSILA